jgi:glycosyltransferase involved in cell wall biosynthesis
VGILICPITFATHSDSIRDHLAENDMPPRLAIFHDNLAQMGGAERVTEALHKAFPEAALYTTLSVAERLSPYLQAAHIHTTWMQRLPWKARFFRHYFLLYPFAVESVDLRAYDVIITSCFGFAKGVRRREDALQVCYCHTPMRWVWRASDYFAKENVGVLKSLFLSLALKPLRSWEFRAARRPDFYIANSHVVARRLKDAFGIDSVVIPPPIETARFHASDTIENYFLILSRLVPYKRLDLAIQAATRLALPLKVVGSGPDLVRLRSLAGPTVEFLGRLPDDDVNRLVSRCQALIFPGEEDFGMAPLEVNAAGRPVIAFHGGGAVETIREGVNGMFFYEPTVDSLVDVVRRFQRAHWDVPAIQKHARSYDIAVFQQRIRNFIEKALEMRQAIPA